MRTCVAGGSGTGTRTTFKWGRSPDAWESWCSPWRATGSRGKEVRTLASEETLFRALMDSTEKAIKDGCPMVEIGGAEVPTPLCCQTTKNGRIHDAPHPKVLDGEVYCTRCYNRELQDRRIRKYTETAPRCPDHPDRPPAVTRWHGPPVLLYCPTPLKREPGQGRMRGQVVVMQWCPWLHAIPESVLQGDDK